MAADIRVDIEVRQSPESWNISESFAAPDLINRWRRSRRGRDGRNGPGSGTRRMVSWKTGTQTHNGPALSRARTSKIIINNRPAIGDAAVGVDPPPNDRVAISRWYSNQRHRPPRKPSRTAIAEDGRGLIDAQNPAGLAPAVGPMGNGSQGSAASSSHRRAMPGTRPRHRGSEQHKARARESRRIEGVHRTTGAGPIRPVLMQHKQPGHSNAVAGPRTSNLPRGITVKPSNGRGAQCDDQSGTSRPRTAWSRPGTRTSGLAGKAAPAGT